jgi:hypothetical protein
MQLFYGKGGTTPASSAGGVPVLKPPTLIGCWRPTKTGQDY